VFGFVVEMQQWFPFALFSCCTVFSNAVKIPNGVQFFMQTAQHFCQILTKSGFSRQILIEVSSIKFQETPSIESKADICG
jgi:hypothetical protein